MRELTEQNFRGWILKEKKPVLIEFYAVWCGRCSMMEDIFVQLEEEFDQKISMARVDTEKNPLLAAEYRIGGLPTFVLFDRGKPVLRMTGVMSAEQMSDAIRSEMRKRQYNQKKK